MSKTLSTTDQQVWRKTLAAKSQSMTEIQLQTSLPQLRPKDLQTSLAALIGLSLMTVSTSQNGDRLYNAQKVQAKQEASAALTPEQRIVKKVIEDAQDRGIPMTRIRRLIPQESLPQAVLRKVILELEKSGHIKTFRAVSAPTTILYHSSKYKPSAELTGGVWYDDNKEFDENLVQVVRGILLSYVRKKSFKGYSDKTNKNGESSTRNAPLWPAGRTPTLPTPHHLLKFINQTNVVQAPIGIKNIMEVMRALELDGLVEIIKPVGGVHIDKDMSDGESDDEDGPSSRKKKKTGEEGSEGEDDDDLEEEEKERRKELAKEKEKERAKIRKKKEREKERRREKEKEKEKKRREKERAKEKKKRKKEKEKEKKKRKKKNDSDSDSLKAISDEEANGKPSKSKSKSRKRSASSSSSSSSSSSGSSSSDSDSSDSDASVSSVNSSDIDSPSTSLRRHRPQYANQESVIPAGLQDLSDTAIVYRATNRLSVPLGQTEVPCGKCPVFDFCAEGGPVDPTGCEYWEGFLEGGKGGGWVGEDREEEKREVEAEVDLEDVKMNEGVA